MCFVGSQGRIWFRLWRARARAARAVGGEGSVTLKWVSTILILCFQDYRAYYQLEGLYEGLVQARIATMELERGFARFEGHGMVTCMQADLKALNQKRKSLSYLAYMQQQKLPCLFEILGSQASNQSGWASNIVKGADQGLPTDQQRCSRIQTQLQPRSASRVTSQNIVRQKRQGEAQWLAAPRIYKRTIYDMSRQTMALMIPWWIQSYIFPSLRIPQIVPFRYLAFRIVTTFCLLSGISRERGYFLHKSP